MTLLEYLQNGILGQQDAVRRFANAFERGERLARERDMPRSVCLLLGPTGVGKTEIVLEAGRFLYGKGLPEKDKTYAGVVRLDMGEFSQPSGVDRLLSPTDSPLVPAFRSMAGRSSFIVHFDEFEKVHIDVRKLFLAVNDAARLTLTDGTKLDFTPCHLVYTSNQGSRHIASTDELEYESIEANVLNSVADEFSPEQMQRFREKIVFTGLNLSVQQELCRRWLKKQLSLQGAHLRRFLRADPAVVDFLIDKGFSKQYGARNMQNVIRGMLGNALLELSPLADDCDVISALTLIEVSPTYDRLIARSAHYEDLSSLAPPESALCECA